MELRWWEMRQIVSVTAVENVNEAVVVTLHDRMDVFNAPSLMQLFNGLLDDGALHFVVDLTDVRVVDADGDYPLLHLLKCAQGGGGSVSLVCPFGNPIRVFYEMMRLDTLFEMAETLDFALDNLKMTLAQPLV